MGKIKPGFKSAEKERKLDAIRQGQFIRKLKRSVSHDHNYSASSKHILTPDISNVTYEEVLNPDGENITPSIEDVLKGRRVVELGVLAENLDCKVCGLPLQLKHTTNLNDFGLGSILKVMCLNQSCGHLNSVPTGGQHDRIWNVNTKVALAAMHIGIGEYQLNSLLSILNIPTVSHKMFDQRTKEIGEVLESLADKSMEHWMEKEKTLTKESTGKEEITVTVDGGWQKRGSGRAYDSLTGHCSMMGVKTGKLLGWKWRSRTCRICERAERKGEIPRVHQCRKNFTGSAKAMESDMVVELIKEAKRKGTDISTIVGDEDSTTIARVRSQVDNNIKKLSDKNHIKKPLVSKLYNLRTSHKSLTVKVINYLVKCFNYLVAQGEGQPQKISQNVKALSKHPFGDHSECSTDWCRFIESTGMKFKSLPYGKPLKDKSLQNSLTDIFDNYAKHSDKLSNLESTQANESFNKSIAAMAPKTKHYGGSGSLGYRIAATAAKKNIGNIYAVHANTSAGLSPGIYTRKLLTLRDLQARKRKAVVTTQKAKLQRIKLKSKRHQSATSLETREGISYKPGICLESDSVDLETIPAPPEIYRMNENLPAANKRNIIYFDLEATGLERTSHIMQIAALREEEKFMCYVIPKKPISQKASEITGMKMCNGTLLHRNEPVLAHSIADALDLFYGFVSKTENNILVGHNIQTYDCQLLFHASECAGKLKALSMCVAGFTDTKKLFKITHPSQESYSQTNLVSNLMDSTYRAHDALEDIEALNRLIKYLNIDLTAENLVPASFSFDTALSSHIVSKKIRCNLPSLKILVSKKVITLRTARLIAKSDLNINHLQIVYRRNGRDGIKSLLSEPCGTNSVRVTKSAKIVDSICSYFSSVELSNET